MRSSRDGIGLALLRLEAISAVDKLNSGPASITPLKPEWMRLPD
jgi:hypothetical protein